MANVLVTGGAGFIGSHICDALLARGDEVVCFDNFDSYYDPRVKHRNIAHSLKNRNFRLVRGDVRNLGQLKRTIAGNGIESIIHEAAQAGVRVSVQDPLKPHEVNAGGTLNVLLAARDCGVEKIVNASSSSVYGKMKYLPFDEGHPKNPISPYGVSKLCAENYCRLFHELYGMKALSLRYFTVYGPRVRPDLAISKFFVRAMRNKPIEIYGDGKKTRDFTYVGDAVNATLLALGRGRFTGEAYNIGGGNRISVKRLAELIITISGSKSELKFTQDQKGDVQDTLADNRKARRELGWAPSMPIEKGLEVYARWRSV